MILSCFTLLVTVWKKTKGDIFSFCTHHVILDWFHSRWMKSTDISLCQNQKPLNFLTVPDNSGELFHRSGRDFYTVWRKKEAEISQNKPENGYVCFPGGLENRGIMKCSSVMPTYALISASRMNQGFQEENRKFTRVLHGRFWGRQSTWKRVEIDDKDFIRMSRQYIPHLFKPFLSGYLNTSDNLIPQSVP